MPLLRDDAREVLDRSARRRLALDGHLQLPARPAPPAAVCELAIASARD